MIETSSGIVQRNSRRGWRGKLKIVAYCLLPTVIVICLAETVVRVGGLDKPLAGSIFFGKPGIADAIHHSDADLFYCLKPGIHTTWQGGTVTTNRLGLRSSEVGAKQVNEFRILSLGESSTFGARVDDDQTYSAQLQKLLKNNHAPRQFTVINAGVCGYTSFQSLRYLETRGLRLQPDLVLFYHEQNDQLATTYSDRELYESRSLAWHRILADYSAVYRVISNALARRRIESNRRQTRPPEVSQQMPLDQSGLAVDESLDTDKTRRRTRVSVGQRLDNLRHLADICGQHDIQLIIIHPAYADSVKHTCELTRFCEQTGVLMYEAHDALHPVGVGNHEYFADECHPNPEGHAALANGLHRLLMRTPALTP